MSLLFGFMGRFSPSLARRRVAALKALPAVAVALLCVHASPAEAQAPRAGLFEAGVFGGLHVINSDNELGNAAGGTWAPTSAMLLGLRLGYNLSAALAVEGELDYEASTFANTNAGASILGFRVGVRYSLMTDSALRPFLHASAGSLSLLEGQAGSSVADTDAHYSLGLGAVYDLNIHWALRGDLRYVAVPGNESKLTHDVMILLGLQWTPGAEIPDSDGDGINDVEDKCKDQAEDKDGFADVDGCPEPDNDNDGLADAADRCPLEAETRNGYLDDDGCPDNDQDGDGIGDGDDKCPDKAEDKDGFQDGDGCPEPDNDKDGILDASDKCPLKAEDKDGFEDADGCPEPDNDKDGVGDGVDKCPNEAETANGFDDGDGCPDTVPEKVAKSFSGAMEGINFETGSAKIKASSNKVLDKAHAILAEFESVRIEIGGHTDNVGDGEANRKLSQDRADSVKNYMVAKGIAADRVVAKGYGDSVSVADNATPKGRAANRRIEFRVLTGNK